VSLQFVLFQSMIILRKHCKKYLRLLNHYMPKDYAVEILEDFPGCTQVFKWPFDCLVMLTYKARIGKQDRIRYWLIIPTSTNVLNPEIVGKQPSIKEISRELARFKNHFKFALSVTLIRDSGKDSSKLIECTKFENRMRFRKLMVRLKNERKRKTKYGVDGLNDLKPRIQGCLEKNYTKNRRRALLWLCRVRQIFHLSRKELITQESFVARVNVRCESRRFDIIQVTIPNTFYNFYMLILKDDHESMIEQVTKLTECVRDGKVLPFRKRVGDRGGLKYTMIESTLPNSEKTSFTVRLSSNLVEQPLDEPNQKVILKVEREDEQCRTAYQGILKKNTGSKKNKKKMEIDREKENINPQETKNPENEIDEMKKEDSNENECDLTSEENFGDIRSEGKKHSQLKRRGIMHEGLQDILFNVLRKRRSSSELLNTILETPDLMNTEMKKHIEHFTYLSDYRILKLIMEAASFKLLEDLSYQKEYDVCLDFFCELQVIVAKLLTLCSHGPRDKIHREYFRSIDF